jgi:hypothetical protein
MYGLPVRASAHRAAVERVLQRRMRGRSVRRGRGGELERGLVRLGARVAEVHAPRSRCRRGASAVAASASCGGVAKKFDTCASVAAWRDTA